MTYQNIRHPHRSVITRRARCSDASNVRQAVSILQQTASMVDGLLRRGSPNDGADGAPELMQGPVGALYAISGRQRDCLKRCSMRTCDEKKFVIHVLMLCMKMKSILSRSLLDGLPESAMRIPGVCQCSPLQTIIHEISTG